MVVWLERSMYGGSLGLYIPLSLPFHIAFLSVLTRFDSDIRFGNGGRTDSKAIRPLTLATHPHHLLESKAAPSQCILPSPVQHSIRFRTGWEHRTGPAVPNPGCGLLKETSNLCTRYEAANLGPGSCNGGLILHESGAHAWETACA